MDLIYTLILLAIILLAIIFALSLRHRRRRRLIVRAYAFIDLYRNGRSAEEANEPASSLDRQTCIDLFDHAECYTRAHYNSDANAMIADARRQGFS